MEGKITIEKMLKNAEEAKTMLSTVISSGETEISEAELVEHTLVEAILSKIDVKPVIKVDNIVRSAALGIAVIAKKLLGGTIVPQELTPAVEDPIAVAPLATPKIFGVEDFIFPIDQARNMIAMRTIYEGVGLLIGFIASINLPTIAIAADGGEHRFTLPRTGLLRNPNTLLSVAEAAIPIPFTSISIYAYASRHWERFYGYDIDFAALIPLGLFFYKP